MTLKEKIEILLEEDHDSIVETLTTLDEESIRRLRAASGDALIFKTQTGALFNC